MTEQADLLQQMRGSMIALFCESSCQERHPNDLKIVVNHFLVGGLCLPTPTPTPSEHCPSTPLRPLDPSLVSVVFFFYLNQFHPCIRVVPVGTADRTDDSSSFSVFNVMVVFTRSSLP